MFVYPIWWGRPPAMLLGFIDRMFAANFAYRDRPGLFPEGLLAGKSAVCVSTMKGPAHYPRFWLNNAHQVLMKRALFGIVGIKRVTFFEFGNMEKKDGDQEKKPSFIKEGPGYFIQIQYLHRGRYFFRKKFHPFHDGAFR